MHRSLFSVALGLSALALFCPAAAAHPATRYARPTDWRTQFYYQVDYPAEVRALRDAIEIARAEVQALDRVQRDYRSINRFRVGSALPLSAERVRIERLAAEQRLRELRLQLATIQRFRAAAAPVRTH